jgi:hypothetical protein
VEVFGQPVVAATLMVVSVEAIPDVRVVGMALPEKDFLVTGSLYSI